MSLIDLEIGVAKLQGGRDSQMDRFDVGHHNFDQNYSLFIIYDGHGDGSFSKVWYTNNWIRFKFYILFFFFINFKWIKHAKENLAKLIINDEEFKKGDYEKAFVNGFRQEDYLLKSTLPEKRGGTTATGILIL